MAAKKKKARAKLLELLEKEEIIEIFEVATKLGFFRFEEDHQAIFDSEHKCWNIWEFRLELFRRGTKVRETEERMFEIENGRDRIEITFRDTCKTYESVSEAERWALNQK